MQHLQLHKFGWSLGQKKGNINIIKSNVMNLTKHMVSKQPKVFWAVDCWDFGPETCQSFPEMPAGVRKDIEYILTDSLIDPVFPGSLERFPPTWRHF